MSLLPNATAVAHCLLRDACTVPNKPRKCLKTIAVGNKRSHEAIGMHTWHNRAVSLVQVPARLCCNCNVCILASTAHGCICSRGAQVSQSGARTWYCLRRVYHVRSHGGYGSQLQVSEWHLPEECGGSTVGGVGAGPVGGLMLQQVVYTSTVGETHNLHSVPGDYGTAHADGNPHASQT